jgi:hypothetical protein
MDAALRFKYVVALWRQHYIVGSVPINIVKGKKNHSDTIVPVIPLRAHSSAMRFSALRLISSECFQRASASSYATFAVVIGDFG